MNVLTVIHTALTTGLADGGRCGRLLRIIDNADSHRHFGVRRETSISWSSKKKQLAKEKKMSSSSPKLNFSPQSASLDQRSLIRHDMVCLDSLPLELLK